jgi:hypothetical protein
VSRMKEAPAAVGARGGAGDWRDAARTRPCPVCGHDSWCQIRRDGAVVLCKRVEGPRRRTNRDGAVYWIHLLAPGLCPALPPPPPVVCSTRADADTLDRAYRLLLGMLGLSAAHRAGLDRRGLPRDRVAANGYRTFPLEGRAKLAARLVEQLGEETAASVPGVYQREEEGRRWWTLAGCPGLLVPVRDLEGRVVALKVRRDGEGDGPRYTYVSSSQHGGPSALCALHVPGASALAVPAADLVRVTEGELKADVCTALSGMLTLSVPGVGAWKAALPALDALGAARVRIAFDADWRENPAVARAMRDLAGAVRATGRAVEFDRWDPAEGKGLDDVLARRAGREVAA